MERGTSSGRDGAKEDEEKTVDEMKAVAMGLFDLTPLQASRLTMYEYELYSLALEVKKQQMREYASFQSWQNQQVQATKKQGAGKNTKYVSLYKKFSDFYDAEKDFDIILRGREETKKSVADFNRLMNRSGG